MFLVVFLTLASYGVAGLIGVPVLVPVLNAAGAWWMMARELRRGRTSRAIGVMLMWAATMGVAATAWSYARPADTRALFVRSDYRDEMHAWVKTGVGAESTPAVFVPRHLAYAGVFSAAALATGGVLAMPMGAMLMNSMADYVGSMAAASAHPLASALLGWHPWAILRIVAFVLLGVVLSGVVLSRVWGFPFSLRAHRVWIIVAGALLVLDITLKTALAPAWGQMLKKVAGW